MLLNELMSNKGMSAKTLAKKIKVSDGAVHHWLQGRSRPCAERREQIKHVLKFDNIEYYSETPKAIKDQEKANVETVKALKESREAYLINQVNEVSRFIKQLPEMSHILYPRLRELTLTLHHEVSANAQKYEVSHEI